MDVSRDQAIGLAICIASILGILVYGWLVFLSGWAMLTLQLTGFIAVGAVLGVLAWIGYTLVTTPPPKPIEEIEKEIEDELRKREEESKSGETSREG